MNKPKLEREYIISDLETLKGWISNKSLRERGLRVPEIIEKIDEIIKMYLSKNDR